MNDHDLRVALARIEERLDGMKVALELQAREYERRLQDLNHAHARAQEVLGTYLPRESYEAYVKDQESKAEALKNSVAETRERLETAVSDLAEAVRLSQDATTSRLESRIVELKEAQTLREGGSAKLGSTGRTIVAAVGALGVIMTIIVLVANGTFSP